MEGTAVADHMGLEDLVVLVDQVVATEVAVVAVVLGIHLSFFTI
jgi:hypothetical protein